MSTKTSDQVAAKIAKYEAKIADLQKKWSASRAGSRYGDENLEIQLKVCQAILADLKRRHLSP